MKYFGHHIAEQSPVADRIIHSLPLTLVILLIAASAGFGLFVYVRRHRLAVRSVLINKKEEK